MADPIIPDPAVQSGAGAGSDKPTERERQLVEEIKDLRQKLSDEKSKGLPTAEVERKIADALRAKEQEEATKNWTKAQESFIAKHKEFHPDNDPGGIKKAALDRELAVLNRNGLTSVDELSNILEKARILATSGKSAEMVPVHLDPSIPRSNPEPRSEDANNLSPAEQRMVAQLGWTAERFLKLKAKDPRFVERALRQAP